MATDKKNLALMPNPYDFANPVQDESLLVGRKREIEDIKYYLDQSKLTNKPINIALIGERASGKTSMLNKIELLAYERNILPVRIDLNESDASTPLLFFYKVFDTLLTTVVGQKKQNQENDLLCFGGINGKTFDTYLDITTNHKVPEDKIFCPFIFPIQFAKSMSSGKFDNPISDVGLKKDFDCIHNELNSVIILLFDEFDVLSMSKQILQMLRNIFMNLDGYMIVFAGTENLFPVMDDVFSPIIRQFKLIDIKPFDLITATQQCIVTPLEKIGMEELWDMSLFSSNLWDIHQLTMGKPYEIQLVCHFIFRRIQRKKQKRFILNIDVLNDVLYELRQGKNIHDSSVIQSIVQLNKKELKLFSILNRCSGHGTLEDIWFCEYVVNGDATSKEELSNALNDFVRMKLLSIENDKIFFPASEFEMIYCKYFIKQKKLMSFYGLMPANLFDILFYKSLYLISVKVTCLMYHKFNSLVKNEEDIETYKNFALKLKANPILGNIFCNENINNTSFYEELLDCSGSELSKISIFVIFLEANSYRYFTLFYINYSEISDIDKLEQLLLAQSNRAKILGGDLEIIKIDFPVPSKNEIVEAVCQCDLNELREECCKFEMIQLFDAYIGKNDPAKALECCQRAEMFSCLTGSQANNVGYVYLASGAYDKAESMLEYALKNWDHEDDDKIFDDALPRYNLALSRLMLNKVEESLELLNDVINLTEDSQGEEPCAALLQIISSSTDPPSFSLTQLSDKPRLSKIARKSLSVIEAQ